MEITPREAQEALGAAQEAIEAVKRAVDRHTSQIVLVWGAVYFLVPLSMHLWPFWGVIPMEIMLIGAIAYTMVRTRRSSLTSGPTSQRIGALWLLTFGFGWMWMLILSPGTFWEFAEYHPNLARQMWAYGVSLAMFVYVVMGLWIGKFYVITGATVAVLTVIGLLCLGEWYWLWCAITGGGTLLSVGIWLRRKRAYE